MGLIYGYARISNPKQNIERQVRNILKHYPDAIIIRETYTATKFDGRVEWEKKIRKKVKPEDKIVFDSVSRMSRDEDEGFDLYQKLFNENITLEFLNEPQINTEVYRNALENQIKIKMVTGNKATDELMSTVIDALNKFILEIAKEQIHLAFVQSQKEVDDLHQRTKEGIETARRHGKQIGQKRGARLNVKKAAAAKKIILSHNKTFGGSLNNEETWILAGITKMTFYKYKKELLE